MDVLHLDLELPSHVARLADPELYLGRHAESLVVLDEVQRLPGVFPVLRPGVEVVPATGIGGSKLDVGLGWVGSWPGK